MASSITQDPYSITTSLILASCVNLKSAAPPRLIELSNQAPKVNLTGAQGQELMCIICQMLACEWP